MNFRLHFTLTVSTQETSVVSKWNPAAGDRIVIVLAASESKPRRFVCLTLLLNY